MMEERLLPERARSPAHHPAGGDGDPVDAARGIRDVASYLLEAPAPKELTAAGHVGLPFEAVAPGVVAVLLEDRARDSETSIVSELAEEELTVVVVERDIGVQVADDLVRQGLDSLVAGIEGVHFARKAALAVRWHLEHLDPGVPCHPPPHHLGCTVGGAIVHDDPSDREDGLPSHGLDRLLVQFIQLLLVMLVLL